MKLRLTLVLTLVSTASLALAADAVGAPDGTRPPITTPPPAGDAAPPADAIVPSHDSTTTCGDWSLQSTYGGRWSVDSTWWEYRCDSAPAEDYWSDYYYWDGSQSVFYGRWIASAWWDYEYYWDCYWWDAAASDWYGSFSCTDPNPGLPPNVAPTASFTATCSGLSCSFDGSASTDSDGTISSYDWNFGDASSAGGRNTAEHMYTKSGTYTVTLSVTDDRGGTAAMSQAVTVEGSPPPPPPPNAAPTASFTFTCSGLTCSFDGSASADSDGTITNYYWDFGDTYGVSGSSKTVKHVYPQAGSYSVTLTVTDNGGATATNGQTVVVTNVAPTASFTFSCSSLDCSFDGTASSDSDGTIESYWWNFGDGTPVAAGSTAQHTYAEAGTYTVTLTVIDNGGLTGHQSKTVSGKNAAPTASFNFSCSGVTCSFDGSASADTGGTIAGYSWNFGDGTTASGSSKVDHAYAKPGTYTVTLTVTDNGGATAAASKAVPAINLIATGSKLKGVQKVDLTWSGSSAATFDVFRNGQKIATVAATAYTDEVMKGSGSYSYKACEAATSTCSNTATVTF